MKKKHLGLATTAAAGAAMAAWWFTDRAPYPYSQNVLLDIPLPFLTSAGLDEILRPSPNERILEIGPGTGLQALHVAPQLGPEGRLDILDIQPEMLTHVARRAARAGLTNIVATQADARDLPFADTTFDAVYLVTALGEITEPQRALSEVVRVLNPSGRLVIGEFFDRHWISFGKLCRLAETNGLCMQARKGAGPSYLARFRRCHSTADRASAVAPVAVAPARR